MANPSITFNIGSTGLGQPADGNDHLSGMLFYSSSLPSGFSSGSRIKQVFSLQQASDLGIDTSYSDGTAATGGGFTVTNAGATNDTLVVKVAELYSTITIASYVRASSDTTVTLVAAGIVSSINAGTSEHGYSATNTAGAITITAPKRIGKYLNSSGVATVITGTIAVGSSTNFSGGVGSKFAIWNYHISEFFRMNPQGVLWIGVYAANSAFTEIKTIQDYALGQIRQMMVYVNGTAFITADVTAMQTVCNSCATENEPLVIVYTPDVTTFATLAALPNLNGLSSQNISVNVGQDLSGTGNLLYNTVGGSIGCGGTELGALSRAKVSDNIAWTGQYNVVNGSEFDKIQFSNGVAYVGTPTSSLDLLTTYKYNYLKKFGNDYPGSFFNLDVTCIASTSDFSRIRNNRTMQKATRGLRITMLPYLNSPIEVNSDGTLTQDVISQFKAVCESALDQMKSNGEISDREINIDGTQNILSTNTLTIGVKIVPIGSAEQIVFNIGFATSL